MCRRWSASTTASIPLRYFEVHRLEPDWSAFLDDFQRHWPTDENIYVDFVRDGTVGNGERITFNRGALGIGSVRALALGDSAVCAAG
jgi:hypothetical protein